MKLLSLKQMDIWFLMLIWLLHATITISHSYLSLEIFNVLDYGAASNVNNDDSQAFLDAWSRTCNSKAENPTLLVPKWKKFLLNPTVFNGPCQPNTINFEVIGDIIAPPSPLAWEKHDPSRWLAFVDVSGLRVYGSGSIDGQGFGWWNQSCKYHPTMTMKFLGCNKTTLSGLRFINSSQTHVTLYGCVSFRINDLSIEAPGNSPNTDGIHLQHAHDVVISNSRIGTGDDCISVGDYTSNIDIINISCGPGHGVSIGSLGRGGSYVQVQNILVRDVYFKGTTNGARIKTWQEGRGLVRRVIYENIFFNAVKNPLIIDQHYGADEGNCTKESMGVRISDVTYKHFYGTSTSEVGINLNCSRSIACTDITLDSIMIWPVDPLKEVTSYCSNAYGFAVGIVHPLSCLREGRKMVKVIDVLLHIKA